MEWDSLSETMQGLLSNLRHASSTIDYDIQDALDDAGEEEAFVDRVDIVMHALIEETHRWIDWVRLVHQGAPPYLSDQGVRLSP